MRPLPFFNTCRALSAVPVGTVRMGTIRHARGIADCQ
jgi:hypothetical protein